MQPPNSVGMVVAPTYPMLRDSVLPLFLELARRAGILVRYHRTDRQADLLGGRVVMFRTADEPERLRGPNLGWFWIDEGALCVERVWPIMIGRLRLAPGRGWVTTSPRGSRNWTHTTFEADDPDYATIVGSTRDAWWNPPWFVPSLLSRYSPDFARQEIDAVVLDVASEGLWFRYFDESIHVTETAEYDPAYHADLAVDSGPRTGAVWFQVRPDGGGHRVTVFADYFAEFVPAHEVALAILAVSRDRCGGRLRRCVTDPAGGARNAIGPTVLAEYERAGLPLEPWPLGSVVDGLELIDSFLWAADSIPRLHVHPRCTGTIAAFHNYRRAMRNNEWTNRPEDPQHPHENMIDALRGGLKDRFPEGRQPDRAFQRRRAGDVF